MPRWARRLVLIRRMIIGPELGFDVYNFHIFTSGRAAGSDRYHSHGDAIKFYVAGGGV